MKRPLLFFLFALSISSVIYAQIPKTLSYQGLLTDDEGNNLQDGEYEIQFKLYGQESSGVSVWEETQNVWLESGIFNVILGKVSELNVPFNKPYWLGIMVDGNPELEPRIELTATAYSLGADFNGLTNIPENIDLDKTDDFDGNYSSLIGAPTNVSSFTNDAGYLTVESDGSDTNELQVLTISNDTLFLSNGGFIKLPEGFDGNYENLVGAPVDVSYFSNDVGYLTAEQDSSVINELQTLDIARLNGTVLELSLSDDGEETKEIDLVSLQTAGSEVQAAENVIINDTAGFYEGANVEQALDELGNLLEKSQNDSILLVGIDSANTFNFSPFSTSSIAEFAGNVGREDVIHRLGNNGLVKWPTYIFSTSKGTIDSPQSISSGNNLGAIYSTGYTGENFGFASGITFQADDSIYNNIVPGAIKFSTSDTSSILKTRMVINSKGNVGIGTANPTDDFQVGDFNKQSDSYLSVNTAGGQIYKSGIELKHYNEEAGFTIYSDDGSSSGAIGLHIKRHHPTFPEGGIQAFSIDRLTGNVGIGTTTPQARLHVLENDTNAVVRIESPGPSYEARVEFKKYGSLGDAAVGFFPGNADLRFRTRENTAFVFEHIEEERMRIAPNGNVGIGTNSPQQLLDIKNGSIMVSDTGDVNALVNRPFIYLNQIGESDLGGGLLWQDNDTNRFELFHYKDANELMFYNPYSGPIAALRDSGSFWLRNQIEPSAIKFHDGTEITGSSGYLTVQGGFQSQSSSGMVTFHPSFGDFVGTTLVGSFKGDELGAQIRFEGARVGFMDIGEDSTGNFVIEGNDDPFLTVSTNGNVGIGTLNPNQKLVVNGNTVTKNISLEHEGRGALFFAGAGDFNHALYNNFNDIDSEGSFDGIKWNVGVGMDIRLFDHTETALFLRGDGNFGIGTNNPTHPLEMASGAHVTAGGVWTNASSRALKENIIDLTSTEAMNALTVLKPVKYNYISEQDESYVGFIAEDVPEVVAMKDRKSLSSMDIVALLTKVVQEQQKSIENLTTEIEKLKKEIDGKK